MLPLAIQKKSNKFNPLPLKAAIQFTFKTTSMSAFRYLKNVAIAITGNLFRSSKNKRQDANSILRNTTVNTPPTGTVTFIASEKNKPESAKELSDYTIF